MKTITKILLFLLLISIPLIAQPARSMAEQDSLRPLPVSGAVWRSAVLPGWGQIYQERLINAAMFSFTSLPLYFQAFYSLEQYNKYKKQDDYFDFTTSLSAAIFLHIANVIDAADAGKYQKPTGWRGSLVGDKPLKSPWGAALRSAVIPGWGQIYNESYIRAGLYLALNGYLIYRARVAHENYLKSKDLGDLEERSLFSWYAGLAYLLTIADAYAGATLYKFDESMEMTVVPQVGREYVAIGLQVKF